MWLVKSCRLGYDTPMPRKKSALFGRGPRPAGSPPSSPSCATKGCTGPGLYKALDPRNEARPPFFLCAEHIKAHNSSLNFYAGMSWKEMEKSQSEDIVWRQPTWPMSLQQKRLHFMYKDPFFQAFTTQAPDLPANPTLPAEVQEALILLEAQWPTNAEKLRYVYKLMVKKYHPDVHSAQPSEIQKLYEDKLKEVNKAYALLRKFLQDSPCF